MPEQFMDNTPISVSELSFKNIFKTLSGLHVVLSPELHILEASNAYLEATHTSRQNCIGQYLLDIFPENPNLSGLKLKSAIEASLNHVRQHKEKHTVPALRYDIKNQQGEYEERYWNLCSIPLLHKNGDLQFILHEVNEITKQVVAEREMKTSQESMRLLTQAAGGTVWDYDLAKNKIAWNDSYKDIFGYTNAPLEHDAADWLISVHPEDIEPVRGKFYKILQSGDKTFTFQYRFKRADGSYAQVLSHGYVIYDGSENRPLRLVGSVLDINKQQEQERQLTEMNSRFERVAMATNDVIWDWNLVTQLVWWNEGFKILFGYNDEVLQQEPGPESWSNRIHPDDYNRVIDSIHHSIEHHISWEEEYRFRCADGTYKLVLNKGYVIRDEQQTPIRMVGAMRDITEKNQMEQQLQESTRRTLLIMESLPLMAWTAAPDGAIDYFNQRWFDYTGASLEEIKNWGWSAYIHPEDYQSSRGKFKQTISKGQPYTNESRWRAKDGSYRWFLARAVPIHDSEGNLVMWVGSHTDIQEQKQMMLTLEESNNKFKLLAESIPHIVWSGRPDGYVDYFNQQWYDYTKMTEEETLGLGWGPALHPDDRESTINDWLQSIKTGEKYERELRLREIHTENYRWFLARALPIRNHKNEIEKWFGTATDINDQKILRERLQDSEKRFRFLAESIPQMVWTTSPEGVVDYFNQRWTKFTGLSLEECLGKDAWLKALHPDDLPCASARWEHSVRTGEYYEIEYRLRNKQEDTYRWFLAQAIPMRNKHNKIVKWFGSCTDIEDHKRAEEELLKNNLELERINQDLDSFVYTASHDLKLPIINMASIFAELTRNAEFKDPDASLMIDMFNKSLKQIHSTINDLSDVVKVQKTKERELEQIDLEEMTQAVAVSIQDMVNESDAQITTDFTSAPTILFTRSSLKSILYNLISNAIKYSVPGRTPKIYLSTKIKGSFIELKVQDNGLGIDLNKHKGKLFQMFKRFHNHVAGSGLGLYIVNRLLTNNEGYINVESEINEGTTFYLYFKQNQEV